ncbi:MAG: DUF2760 domain-containing protein [Thermodesulforhabdaceae bacterium]
MKQKTLWSWQSFFLCAFFNGLLGAAIFVPFSKGLSVVNQYLTPLTSQVKSMESLPPELGQVLTQIKDLVAIADQYGTIIIWGSVAVLTLALWLSLLLTGRRRIEKASEEAKKSVAATPAVTTRKEVVTPEPQKKSKEETLTAAFQILSIFQRQGRFIDFLKEDLSLYDDAQVGAAVRNLQESWKKAFQEYFTVEPIFKEPEGSQVTISAGFDASKIKLTGEVIGEPPFEGVVVHRGWKLVKVDLPVFTGSKQAEEWVIAPAEVEIQKRDSTDA